jgi:hypothetical protein
MHTCQRPVRSFTSGVILHFRATNRRRSRAGRTVGKKQPGTADSCELHPINYYSGIFVVGFENEYE